MCRDTEFVIADEGQFTLLQPVNQKTKISRKKKIQPPTTTSSVVTAIKELDEGETEQHLQILKAQPKTIRIFLYISRLLLINQLFLFLDHLALH